MRRKHCFSTFIDEDDVAFRIVNKYVNKRDGLEEILKIFFTSVEVMLRKKGL